MQNVELWVIGLKQIFSSSYVYYYDFTLNTFVVYLYLFPFLCFYFFLFLEFDKKLKQYFCGFVIQLSNSTQMGGNIYMSIMCPLACITMWFLFPSFISVYV